MYSREIFTPNYCSHLQHELIAVGSECPYSNAKDRWQVFWMALITVERCFFVISYEGVMSTVVGIQGVMFQVSRLPNGLTVASLDMAGAVSQLVIAFRAGARYEEPREAGLVHHLRNAVGIDSKNYLGAQMLWQCGSVGANLVSKVYRSM